MRIERRAMMGLMLAGVATAAQTADAPRFTFEGIEGGRIDLGQWRGQPVLVVNTASLCGFVKQYDALQTLQDRYADRGLVVLVVPSDDFRQELATGAEVKSFCALNFGLTLPMTAISHVTGPEAHPFYRWMAESHGFTPGWNFNKVLLGRDGQPVATWGAPADPLSAPIIAAIEAALG